MKYCSVRTVFMAGTMKRMKLIKKRATKRRGSNKKSLANALRKLSKLHPTQRVTAMKMANDKFVRQFCQKVKMLRHTRLPLKTQQLLRRRAKNLRKLVSPKTSMKVKRRMLSQQGGFLSALIGPLIGIVASAIGGALRK